MSEPIDDNVFEEYLGRRSRLSQQYRELPQDEVPAELDLRVLALSREALAASPSPSQPVHRRPAWMRWTAPLALAASAVLIVAVVIESGTRHEVSSDLAMPASPPVTLDQAAASRNEPGKELESAAMMSAEPEAAREPVPASRPVLSVRQQREKKAQEVLVTDSRLAAASNSPSSIAVPPATPPVRNIEVPAPALPMADNGAGEADVSVRAAKVTADDAVQYETAVITAQNSRSEAARPAVGPRGTINPALPERQSAFTDRAVPAEYEVEPQKWLEHIRQLRKDSKAAEADEEWQRFREKYPQYEVAEEDEARPGKSDGVTK